MQVPEGKQLADPPLLRLESEACHAYLSMLLHLNAAGSGALRSAAHVEQRLELCTANLDCFEVRAHCMVGCPAEKPLFPDRNALCPSVSSRCCHQHGCLLHYTGQRGRPVLGVCCSGM